MAELPPNPLRYLTDWLFEIGPSVPVGMGEAPVGWTDMAAWQRLTGVELAPWEAKAIRAMSTAFIAQRNESRKPTCPAPYTSDVAMQRDKVANQFAAMVSALKSK